MNKGRMTVFLVLGQQNLIIPWQWSDFWKRQEEEEEKQFGSVIGQGAVKGQWI